MTTTEKRLSALDELKSKRQWVCWCLEPGSQGKMTKIPYNPHKGYKASTTNPKTWATHQAALKALKNGRNADGKPYSGIGFVFNEDMTGIDFDHCVKDGVIDAWAQKWIEQINSFAENSPSQTGVHVLAHGLIPKTKNAKGEMVRQGRKIKIAGQQDGAAIEMYSVGRFFTVTGNHIDGTPDFIEDRQDEVECLYAYVSSINEEKAEPATPPHGNIPSGPEDLSDRDLLEKAFSAKNGAMFQALWNGSTSYHNNDHSSADQALCNLLAFWTGNDAVRMDRLFRQSGLYREDKWDRNARSGETYGQGTINRAIANCREVYTGPFDAKNEPVKRNKPDEETRQSPTDIDAIMKAIESQDPDALFNIIPALAALSTKEYMPLELKIKASFGKNINMNTFVRALSEERKATAAAAPRSGMVRNDLPYERTSEGMLYTFKGETIFLSNFAAEIITDITTDDGVETARSYELDVTLFNEHHVIELPAKEFSRCEWVDEQLGASAIITAGQSTKAHLVNAIKTCSQAEKQYNYAHTGWRKVNGVMVYLHNDGCVSQVSQVNISNENYLTQKNQIAKTASQASLENNKNGMSQVSQVSQVNTQVRVKLDGTLSLYKLPDVVNVDIREAIHSSLRYLDLTSDIITVPLYASLWRSVLGRVNYGVHLAGQSGLGKTELVVLLQQYFGTEFSSDNLPGSWESTDNALETLLFKAKEAVVVVDDFKPNGTSVDQQRWHSRADRIFRSIGNGIGRSRMTSDLKQRAQRPPRCLLISTGEDFPKGQSCQARGIMLTMTEKIVVGESAKRLKQAQRDGRDGVYVQVMTAYLQWLAPRIETIQAQLKNLTEDERDRISLPGHARAGTNTANMIIGMKYFLQFAVECGAISQEDGQSILNRCLSAFQTIAKNAASSNDEQKPSEQWKRLLIAAITNKSAHLTTDDRQRPCPGVEYGWVMNLHEVDADGTSDTREMVRPGGDHIGWICGDDIYLDPGLAYKAVKAMGAASGDDITTAEPMLRKLLAQDKVLASTMQHLKSRPTLTVRRRLDNAQRNVLHLKKSTLFSDDSLSMYEMVDSLDSDDYQTASQAPSDVSQAPDSTRTKSAQSLDSGHDSALDSHVNPVTVASEKIAQQYNQAKKFLEEFNSKGCRLVLDKRNGRFDVRMVDVPKDQDEFVKAWNQLQALKESLIQVLRDQESA